MKNRYPLLLCLLVASTALNAMLSGSSKPFLHNENPLFYAYKNRQWDTAKQLISEGNTLDLKSKHLLYEACRNKDMETVKDFCSTGIDLARITLDSEETPLDILFQPQNITLLFQPQNIDLIQRFLDQSMVNLDTFFDFIISDKNIASLFVNNKIKIKSKRALPKSMLQCACERGNLKAVRCLLAYEQNVGPEEMWQLTKIACLYGYLDIVQFFIIEKKVNVKYQDSKFKTSPTLLHSAAYFQKNQSLEIVEFLLDYGADVNAKTSECDYGNTPLVLACEENNFATAKRLIKRGADVNVIYKDSDPSIFLYTPLLKAWKNHQWKIAKLLIKAGANVNVPDSYKGTILHTLSSRFDLLHITKLAILNNAIIDARDAYGSTPLNYACVCDNIDIIQCLIEAGANVNAKDNYNLTPLVYACENSNLEAVKYLIAYKADVNAKSQSNIPIIGLTGPSLLIRMCQKRQWDIAQLLVSSERANLREKDNNDIPQESIFVSNLAILPSTLSNRYNEIANGTALHYAAYDNNIEMIQCLVLHGATDIIEINNDNGKTAFDLTTNDTIKTMLKNPREKVIVPYIQQTCGGTVNAMKNRQINGY